MIYMFLSGPGFINVHSYSSDWHLHRSWFEMSMVPTRIKRMFLLDGVITEEYSIYDTGITNVPFTTLGIYECSIYDTGIMNVPFTTLV